ncbi:MAG: restriction endonuclease [Rhodospirillaceae bacterium]|nr:MAG: restriction endonuclease [Rhodospirillaceae bacterium]
MAQGLLAQSFSGVAVKRLSAVEVDRRRSHQHEFNGVSSLKLILGVDDRKQIPTRFLWLGGEQEAISEDGFLSWYESRPGHPTRSEYRLYFPTTTVSELASEGDMVFIATCPDHSMMVIITPAHSTIENQIAWLFGVQNQLELAFEIKKIQPGVSGETEFAVRYILEELGLEPEEPETGHFDEMLARFDGVLPTTRVFSEFARSTLKEVSAKEDPDLALISWMEREEALFRRFERYLVEDRLKEGFVNADGADVDGFLKFSLSVQNRRKSRVGLALENHLEEVFHQQGVHHARGAMTENRSKPDFLFPGISEYHDVSFPHGLLTMLGSKSTCKDRWRQVLPEADRISQKHLFTLEPGISEHQTAEMRVQNLQLVLPKSLHSTYRLTQQSWLMSLQDFIGLVKDRE